MSFNDALFAAERDAYLKLHQLEEGNCDPATKDAIRKFAREMRPQQSGNFTVATAKMRASSAQITNSIRVFIEQVQLAPPQYTRSTNRSYLRA